VLDDDSDSPETSKVDATNGPTILFMPHCDLTLYERVLCVNWTLDRLENILFICNHFDDYLRNNSIRSLESAAPHVLQIAPGITSTPLPFSSDWPGAFNNTSVQFLSKEDASSVMQEKAEDAKSVRID